LTNADQDVLDKELNDLKEQLVNIKSECVEESNDEMEVDYPSWKLYENWKKCPIGTLPDGTMPVLDMDVLMGKE
jgi:hypothetical protein